MMNTSFTGNSSDGSNNSTSVDSSSSDSAEFRIIKLFLYAIIFLISVIGNALVCIVIVKRCRMRTVTNCFILNLAVADLAITCICIPFDIPVQENNYKWPYGGLLCKLLYPLQTIAMFASIFTLMAVSLNRFWAIVYPLHTQMTKRHAKGFISAIWLLSALVTFPYMLVLRLNKDTMSCEEHWPANVNFRKAYTLFLFLAQYVIPLTVITAAYLKIALEMRKCIDKRTQKPSYNNTFLSKSHQTEGKRVVRMLVVVTALFAICVLPNNIMWLWLDFGNGEEYEHFWDVVAVTNIILFANSAANPIAYTICHENFREEFRHYFKCNRDIFKAILEVSSNSRKGPPSTAWTLIYSVNKRELKRMLRESPETNV